MSFENAEWPDAVALAAHVRSGETSPVAIVERAFEAIEALDGALHAFVTLAHEEALAAAIDLERRIGRGEPVGPLAGVPIAIKDLILTAGMRTTFGSRLYADYIPDVDDIAVARLRAADAIVIGKTNAAEFGYGGFGHNPLFPTTRNPWDLSRTPGGSSAGSAAAVAAGITPLALGSDGGGSVRLPAAFSGLVGIKASMGRIPLWPGCRDPDLPGASGWESVEHLGPLARTVADAALMIDVMSGPDPRDRLSVPSDGQSLFEASRNGGQLGLKIASVAAWDGLAPEPTVRAAFENALRVFERDLGCSVEDIPSPTINITPAYRAIVAMETDLVGLRRMASGREAELSAGVRKVIQRQWSAEDFTNAIVERKRVTSTMSDIMARYDLVLTPTVGTPAFAIDRNGPGEIAGRRVADDAWTPALFVANFTGQPAASVPAGWTEDGLPVGLHIMGRHLGDATLVRAAAAFEAAALLPVRRPPISVSSMRAAALSSRRR